MASLSFRPRARLISALGYELISSETTAVVELVKNSFDADAKRVVVRFEGPLNEGEGRLVIADDGLGMSHRTLTTVFLEPATPDKVNQRVTPSGRRKLGEKGIGRFAAGRLSEMLRVVTRQRDRKTESILSIDWTEFEKSEYLDEVMLAASRRKARLIMDGGLLPRSAGGGQRWRSGTVLELNRLRCDWDEDMVQSLRDALSRLLRPGFHEDFVVTLSVVGANDALHQLSGDVKPPPFLDDPDYRLSGEVKAGGEVDLNYESRKSEPERITITSEKRPAAASKCGSFRLELRVWDRDPDQIGDLATRYAMKRSQIREVLTSAAGVSVYRDGFRILPYGQPDNDWLRLDLRRVQNPTLRVSQNQLVGFVQISGDGNPELRDQTNREGLIESPALEDLRTTIRWVLSELETRRYRERPRRNVGTLAQSFEEFQLPNLREFATDRRPNDFQLTALIREEERRLGEARERIRKVLVRYRRWAALGRVVEIILHDASNSLAAIGSAVTQGVRIARKTSNGLSSSLLEHFETIRGRREALASLFDKIRPFSGRGRSKIERFSLADVVEDALELYRREVVKAGVDVSVTGDAEFVGARADIEQVIFNLLDNSMYWMRQTSDGERRVKIRISIDRQGFREVLFSDSGPGVPEAVRDRIFEPWFSTKPDGAGMGLDIVGEIAEDYRGDLALLESEPRGGATFRVRLRNQEGA